MMFNLLAHPTELESAIRYDWKGLEGRSLGDLRIACWANDEVAPVARDVEAAVMKVAQAFKDAGAKVNEQARPHITSDNFNRLYQDMLWGFLAAGMSDDEHKDLINATSNLPKSSQDEVTRSFRAMTMDHRNWLKLHNQREHLRWAWHTFFKDFDLVISPVTATAAFPHDPTPITERKLDVDESSQAFLQQFFWAGLPNIPQLPSTVIPTGVNSEGLPIGVQIIGPAYGDKLTLEVAELLEGDGFAFQAPPNY
jgi:amidase